MFKIFIVEDELTIRTELKTLLEKYGYECITSDDFTSVLSAIEAASPSSDIIGHQPAAF